MRICVVGLGKIGLPLAVQYAPKGHLVTGVDVQQSVVDQVNAGIEPTLVRLTWRGCSPPRSPQAISLRSPRTPMLYVPLTSW